MKTGRRKIEAINEISVGSYLGEYKITRKIGQGGLGVVYLGEDQKQKRSVAIKVLRDDKRFPESIERFKREIQALARLVDVPHVVKFYDKGKLKDGTLYMVMEYVDGWPLDRLIDSNVPDSETLQKRMAIFQQILEAVQSAHRCGVVHRDLKPGNIMVDREGQVKLMDFGFAVLDKNHDITKKPEGDEPGDALGTPPYCPPSQIVNLIKTDERADRPALNPVLRAHQLRLFRLSEAAGNGGRCD